MRGPIGQIRMLQDYARYVGWGSAFQIRLYDLMLRRLNFQSGSEIRLKLKNASYPLRMRTGKNCSDREVLAQIFMPPEYESISLISPRTIIDLGANVGYSSFYFISRYPNAKVVAVEPDPQNVVICRKNLAPFGTRAIVLHGAAWPKKQQLAVRKGVFRDGRDWATQVCSPGDSENSDLVAQGYDMDSLIALAGSDEIDLLKIDIERSERQLFSRNTETWLPKIKNICIELHDEECSTAFFSALSRYEYEPSRCGELTICSNLRPLLTNGNSR